jgi:hypothetical protein
MARRRTPKAPVQIEPPADFPAEQPADVLPISRQRETTPEIRDAAKIHVPMAIRVLAEVAEGKNNPASARVSAALAIIERAEGKAPQAPQAPAQSGPSAAEMIADHARAVLEMSKAMPEYERTDGSDAM